MTRRSVLATGLSAGTIVSSGDLSDGWAPSETVSVLGWYPSWGRYDEEYLPADVPFELLDAMYYANFEPSPDGTVGPVSDLDRANLEEFRALKRNGGPAESVRMGFAIGGWNSSTHFSDAALTPESRERFATTAVELLRRYDFDGFEIDWEFPTGGGREENVERAADVENVVKLVAACRRRLDRAMAVDDRTYWLSYSAPAQPRHITPLDVERLASLLDWINVMSYDLAGPSKPTTAHNAPVFGSPSADEAVRTWVSCGMTPSQMMLGHAFYGRSYDGVTPGPNDQVLGQPYDEYDGILDYPEIRRRVREQGWERRWDERANATSIYNADSQNWVSAADPAYIEAKTSYAMARGCRGVFAWELGYDPDGVLLEAMNETIEANGGTRRSRRDGTG